MAKQVSNLAKEQIEFVVRVWSSEFYDRAPSSRNYLYDYIKSKHPDFTCGSDVLREAQRILKDNVKHPKGNFDSISPIQTLQDKAYEFAMELRSQFISEAMELSRNEIADLKTENQLLRKDVEFYKNMEKHYETQCSLKDLEINKLLKELEALKAAAANKAADANVDSSNTTITEEAEELASTSVLMPEAIEGAKEALDAINEAKAKTKPKRSYHRKTPEEAAAAKAAKEAKAAEREAKKQAKSKSKGTELSEATLSPQRKAHKLTPRES